MKYYVNLFSPETYEAYKKSNQEVSGFRIRQKNAADRIQSGDKLLCYLTKLSRWFGILEVVSGPYINLTACLSLIIRLDLTLWFVSNGKSSG